MPLTRITRTCIGCGAEFKVPPSQLNHSACIWCSHKCRYSTPGWHESVYSPSLRLKLTCPICGVDFTRNKARIKTAKYCSKDCLGIANGRSRLGTAIRVTKSCTECEKLYTVKKYAENRSRFCSRTCRALSNNRNRHILRPTKIEKALHACLRNMAIDFVPEMKFGRFSIDIAFPALKLAVEADGTYWHSTPKQKVADARKDAKLAEAGWTLLRFTEDEINADADKCALRIRDAIKTKDRPSSNSPKESNDGRSE